MPRQTSIQLTEATLKQVEALKARGYETLTNIVRIAIDRMYQQETHTMTNALVTLAQKIIDNEMKYAVTEVLNTETGEVSTDDAAIREMLTKTEYGHNQTILQIVEQLRRAIALHEEGLYSDDKLADAINEAHLDILNEWIATTQESEFDKRVARKA